MNTFWTIQTDDGVMVERIHDDWVDEDHKEPNDPKQFKSLDLTVWNSDWDEPKIWKSKEDAQKDFALIPKSLRSQFHIVEWVSSRV